VPDDDPFTGPSTYCRRWLAPRIIFPLPHASSQVTKHEQFRHGLLSEEVKEIAWKAQHRLHKRYRTLSAAGKEKQKVITAVGRELLGFIWAIGVQVERNRKPVA
jgi:hypothetical protein